MRHEQFKCIAEAPNFHPMMHFMSKRFINTDWSWMFSWFHDCGFFTVFFNGISVSCVHQWHAYWITNWIIGAIFPEATQNTRKFWVQVTFQPFYIRFFHVNTQDCPSLRPHAHLFPVVPSGPYIAFSFSVLHMLLLPFKLWNGGCKYT